MWTLRAAVRRGLPLVRAACSFREGFAPSPRDRCVRALSTFGGQSSDKGRSLTGSGGGATAGRGRKEEDEEEDEAGEEVEDEELLLEREPLLPQGAQRVFLLHPDVKWGAKKQTLTRAELQVAEAKALVHTLMNWSVEETMIVSTKTPDKKLVFGKGNFELLTEKIRGSPQITSVFLNVERMSPLTKKELETAWGVEVFDRFTIVLHIFRCNAMTKEAKLQIALAEIPLLRSNLRNEVAQLDQQGGGGSRSMMGSGETFMQLQQRILKEKEIKIKKALEKLKKRRHLLRSQRKTTLIKALTGDAAIQPRDQLFATLDITAHSGSLPSRMTVVYVDTIGFLSQLPHDLIESFSATLEDVAYSDVIIHVRDISHPETDLQKASVLSVLKNLNLPNQLLSSVIEVHNKVDLVERYEPTEPNAITISALLGHGLEKLKAEIESAVLKATGKKLLTLKIKLQGAQLSWLYKEATVQEVDVIPENGTANVKVIISNSAYGKYRKLFPI
ncbi:putative GTP-binding protein 6 isoform X2 [Trichosurus vulpecula]|uniref:putative GTP-binding protein 6 isoform X2 n=1 Tax=Trichosurus vulpecula TaxID=9337 RepID=UPI00186B4AF5|nr:putative GTP-binding protein 6 isoform X2 [Trichosurus vulpecula]